MANVRRGKRATPTAEFSHPTPRGERRGPPRGLDLEEFGRRAREYVETQASAKVVSVRFEESFRLFGAEDVVLLVKVIHKHDPYWWVIGGSTPMNLYSRRIYRTADEAFSLHCGLMLRLSDRNRSESANAPEAIGYDAFISHASEDKERFVRPLAKELSRRGLRVWYDEFALRVGDSLHRSIDQGLASSRFGVVVLSKAFFAKQWPQYELDGLVAREIEGTKVILPVWFGVTRSDVLKFSPTLADKVAANGSSVLKAAKVLIDAMEHAAT
jgi:TIR domain-containing protein